MKINNTIITFLATLIIGITLTFLGHIYVLETMGLPTNENKINLAYIINPILAAFIFISLDQLKKNYAQNLGFMFMASSLFKFAIFFILFYPTYNLDGEVTRIEFSSFFIPYGVSLLIETLFLVKLLNKID